MKNFTCLGARCPNHCCGAYDSISPQLKALGDINFSEIILLPEDVTRLKGADLTHLIVAHSNGLNTIQTAPDGTCAALKDGKCSIYDSRPAICRAYPLYLDMYTGVCVLQECPAVPEDLCLEDCRDELNCLLDIYRYWIDYYGTHVESPKERM